jgi:hypothetical protein
MLCYGYQGMHNMLSSMLYITCLVPITCPIHPKHVWVSPIYIWTRRRAADWHLRLLADLIFSLIASPPSRMVTAWAVAMGSWGGIWILGQAYRPNKKLLILSQWYFLLINFSWRERDEGDNVSCSLVFAFGPTSVRNVHSKLLWV